MSPNLEAELKSIVAAVDGWCSIDKARWLAELIIKTSPRCLVEIGVWAGRSFAVMAAAVRTNAVGRVFGIDSYTCANNLEGIDAKTDTLWNHGIDFDAIHIACIAMIAERRLAPWVTLLHKTSADGLAEFPDWSIDLLHIDGCHGSERSYADVVAGLRKTRLGGVIVLDDTDWESVQPARRLLLERCELIHSDGTWEAFRLG